MRWRDAPTLSDDERAIVVADPDDSLRFARTAPTCAALVLTSARRADSERQIATPKNLRAALAGAAKAHWRLFAFFGHAIAGTDGLPASAALVLARGTPLYAHEIVSDRGSYPMPQRVLLGGCGTGGLEAGGFGEWLGLTTAMLWAGASAVVATAWPVLNHPQTESLHLRLADRLATADNPAVSLRDLQLRELDAWRQNRSATALLRDGSGDDPRRALLPQGPPWTDETYRPPIFWAAYLVCSGPLQS